jgi:four helix bundle protein
MKHNFRKLNIWNDGMELVFKTYKMTKTFPSEEKFNLVSQINRCAVSIPSNIAEGTSKSSEKHFKNYLETSIGSAFEWETQLIIAYKLNYISKEKFEELENTIQKLQNMIHSFSNRLSA